MDRIRNFVIGVAYIGIGWWLYTPFVQHIYTPLYDLLKAQCPTLPEQADMAVKAIPFVLLVCIFILGFRKMFGKGDSGGDATIKTEKGTEDKE